MWEAKGLESPQHYTCLCTWYYIFREKDISYSKREPLGPSKSIDQQSHLWALHLPYYVLLLYLQVEDMSHGKRGALARSKSIDQQIDEERQRRHNEIQLLILGKLGLTLINDVVCNAEPLWLIFITRSLESMWIKIGWAGRGQKIVKLLEFFHFEVNSNLSNYWKAKVITSMTLHYLPEVMGHRYSRQETTSSLRVFDYNKNHFLRLYQRHHRYF